MSEPLKVGLIGTGSIAKFHLPAYLEHSDRVQLTAVCDIHPPSAKEFAKIAGVDAIFHDYHDMLRNADIDAVDICTVHDLHAPQGIAAAEAGKHVIVEKAMASTLSDAWDMVDAADKACVTLMVAQHLRYSPEALAVKHLLDEGQLGEVQAARTHVFRQGPELSWYTDGQAGGGVLMLNTVHYIDLLRYYIGNVKRVTGICKSIQPQMTNGADDLVTATLEFENGAIGDVFSSWTSGLAPEKSAYLVLGSEGTIHSTPPETINDNSPIRHFGKIMVAKKGSGDDFHAVDSSDISLPSTSFFVNEILHFEECIRTGREPLSSGHDNIETMKVVAGIQDSSRLNRPVVLADL